MDLFTIDFETYWDKDHTLSKMSSFEYVMHPDTELISMSIKPGDHPTMVVFGRDDIVKLLRSVDWSNAMVIGHNMSDFDALILAHRLGVRPRLWGCTLAMARPRYSKLGSLSLGSLAKLFDLGVKDDRVLLDTKGKHLSDFTDEERRRMAEYNRDDSDLCFKLFQKLMPGTSIRELRLIDMTIRMSTELRFDLDTELLKSTRQSEVSRRIGSVVRLGLDLGLTSNVPANAPVEVAAASIYEDVRSMLASTAKMKLFLERRGVDVPVKISPTTGAAIPALAKSDEDFVALAEHEDPIVAAAVRARLDIKSTLLETRIDKFLATAELFEGKLPIPLRYYGADTTGRWSGTQYNPQNLPRIPRDKEGNIIDKPTNALRLSLRAPPGRKVIVADQSGIELRVNHFLWRVPSSIALYRKDPKADLYSAFAAKDLYHTTQEEVTKAQRQVAKVAQLGLGFGAGPPTFQRVAKVMGGVALSAGESSEIVNVWRAAYADIVRGWRRCHNALSCIKRGEEMVIDDWGLCKTAPEGIVLPTGRTIYYPGLRKESDDEWWYGYGSRKAYIYAGKVTENIVQAIARDVLADNAIEFYNTTGHTPALMVHDELVYVVDEDEAEDLLTRLQNIMRTPPLWWPELVTWSEGDIADCYGEAK